MEHPASAAQPRQPTLVDRISLFIQRCNGLVLTVLAFSLVICVTWQVASRYAPLLASVLPEVLARPLRAVKPSTATEELARFTFMWIGLLGAVQASALKQHLAIDLMAMKLKGVKRRVLEVFIEGCIIVFAALVMIGGGWTLTAKTFANHQITPSLQIPMGYVYAVVPVAGVLMVFFAAVAIYRAVIGREE